MKTDSMPRKRYTESAVLLPKRLLGLSFQIALPENVDGITKVLNAFSDALPFDEAKDYLASLRLLDRLAHWLRLT